jgi:hypothetical protein
MRFTSDELAKIASWTPVFPGFDQEESTVENLIRPILNRLLADNRLRIRVTQDGGGGLSNYFAFLAYDSTLASPIGVGAHNVPCVVVQLSLMAPVGVFGKSTFSETDRSFGWSPLSPEQVCDPASPEGWVSAAVVAVVHEASPYRFVGREVTDQPLPAGVTIHEYCLCEEPWNRAFHALFADTD